MQFLRATTWRNDAITKINKVTKRLLFIKTRFIKQIATAKTRKKTLRDYWEQEIMAYHDECM